VQKSEKTIHALQQEVEASWDGARHLFHSVEVEEVKLTGVLVKLSAIESDAARALANKIKKLGGALARAKQQCTS
jgi:hypothetical protein